MLRLYDTLSGKKRDFRPRKGKLVRIYTCGPSVYAYSHIGNFRTYLFEDILVRYLRYKGYKVKRVMNITDVEDKAIVEARKTDESLAMLQKDKIRSFFADFDALGMVRPDVVAKASDHVPQMINLIERICSNGYCIHDKSGVYFNVRKFRDYGNLAHLKTRRYFGLVRKDDYSKNGLWDFRLWKFWSRADGKACWESAFGMGRPGWHIECSAMAIHYLGDSIDIHCGGSDNIFPHHENEIAQSESATGKKFANFWLHCRHLTVNKKKMSKRTGNVYYVRQLKRKGVPPLCLRYYLISENYRCHLDFNISAFKRRICDCHRVRSLMEKVRRMSLSSGPDNEGRRIAKALISGFEESMEDDLNTKMAFDRIYKVFDEIEILLRERKLSGRDALRISDAIDKIDDVLWVF